MNLANGGRITVNVTFWNSGQMQSDKPLSVSRKTLKRLLKQMYCLMHEGGHSSSESVIARFQDTGLSRGKVADIRSVRTDDDGNLNVTQHRRFIAENWSKRHKQKSYISPSLPFGKGADSNNPLERDPVLFGLYALVRQFNEGVRNTLYLACYHEMKHKEIAEIERVTVHAIDHRMKTAISELLAEINRSAR